MPCGKGMASSRRERLNPMWKGLIPPGNTHRIGKLEGRGRKKTLPKGFPAQIPGESSQIIALHPLPAPEPLGFPLYSRSSAGSFPF